MHPSLKLNRRTLLKGSAAAAAAVGAAGLGVGNYWLGRGSRVSRSLGKKVIVIGVDGMDPRLSESMMKAGLLPNLEKLRAGGGFSDLGTSTRRRARSPGPTSSTAPGPARTGSSTSSTAIPQEQCAPFYSAAETVPGKGSWEVGDHRLPLDFWPFNHKPPATVLRRQGTPFWDYLDAAGIPSTFYDLPSNYPASPSHHGHHRCICGMGTPDMLGHLRHLPVLRRGRPGRAARRRGRETVEADLRGRDGQGPHRRAGRQSPQEAGADRGRVLDPPRPRRQRGGDRNPGPANPAEARPVEPLDEARFRALGPGVRAVAEASAASAGSILQEVAPNFRLYVTPDQHGPARPAQKMSEPESFIQDVAGRLGPFYTTGFQEDHKARSNGIFSDDEFARQAGMVLDERLALFDYAINNYDDGLLFFYFSSSDLQSHIFWWDSDEKHPIRSEPRRRHSFGHVRRLYQKLDAVIGDLDGPIRQPGDDHRDERPRLRQLRQAVQPQFLAARPAATSARRECTSIMHDVDWSQTMAYGLGINGLYLNMKGRERDGIVEPGEQREAMLAELKERLEAVTDCQRQAGDPRRLSLGPDLSGQRDGPGARPDRRLSPRLTAHRGPPAWAI